MSDEGNTIHVHNSIVTKVKKRDGRVVEFVPQRITDAIYKAAQAVGGTDKQTAIDLSKKVITVLEYKYDIHEIPTVEDIQDIVERVLIKSGHSKTAKAYIIYRSKRAEMRKAGAFLHKVTNIVDGYVGKNDWRVKENSNTSYAISGLQAHISGAVIAEYTLENIYPKEIAEAHRNADFHIHDLSVGVFAGYSFYRNEVVVVRNKADKLPLVLSLEQLYSLVDAKSHLENGFEIKYTGDYEVWDEKGWTSMSRVLRHKTTKPLISLNTFNGKNVLITNDHPFITLEDEKRIEICPECNGDNIIKNRTNKVGKDYFKCKSCNHTFGLSKENLPDITRRKEVYAENIKLNNYAITPSLGLEPIYVENTLTSADGWFIGMFVAEGYVKCKRLVFEMSASPELRKIIDYLSQLNINFSLNYSQASSGQIQLQQEANILSVRMDQFSAEMQELLSGIRSYAHNKNLPITMLNLGQNIVGSMVSGIIDGDGVVRNDDHWVSRINLRMTSKTLLSQTQFWLESQGVNSSLLTIDSYGERKYDGLTIKSKKQLYSLTFYIPEGKKILFSESIKIDDNFKFSDVNYKPKAYSHFRKIEAVKNDDEYVYDITTSSHTFTSNGMLVHNCAGWSIKDILQKGFNGVKGRVAASPAKHMNALLGQLVNFLGTLQNEWAGAQAFSSFDTYLAPFVREDGLNYEDIKQRMQEFIFSINQTSRWGNQVPFTNLTFDWVVPEDMKDEQIIIGGERKETTYGEYQKEMDLINKAFMEVMMKGDMNSRIFTFPIPTYNITKDFDWDSENSKLLFDMTAKYGTPYFQNFVNSSLNPSDVRSMCCRLQLDIRQLRNKTGGLFGSGEKTGSVGVITINLPRLAYTHKNKDELFKRLDRLMELASQSLEIKRKEVTKNMNAGLLPYTKEYLGSLDHHFATIGVNGMNECCMNFLGKDKDVTSKEGKAFAIEILDHMRAKLQEFQEKTGNIYNLEATPAEGTAYRFAKHDRKEFPEIIAAGTKETPYYTNSSQLPVNYTKDVFEALDHQDELQCKYTGGTVLHGFIGEKISDWKVARELIKKVTANYKLPYFSITPTFSICPIHGYLSGEHFECPHDHSEEELEKYGIVKEAG